MITTDRDTFGLSERDLQTLRNVFAAYPEIEEVRIFGSRAKGNYHKGSDVDLAVMNEGVSVKSIRAITALLSESSLPYRVDLVNFPALSYPDFIEHINRVGRLIYKKIEGF